MHRFYLPPGRCRGDALTLDGSEAHHATRVLRTHAGERVQVLDGVGQTLDCEVVQSAGKSLSLKVLERKRAAAPPSTITLLQAIPKGKVIESIIQKATELGVSRVVPIVSERVISQMDSDDAQSKAAKWQHVAIEAIKQCGSPWLPKVEAPVALDVVLARREEFELSMVGCLEPDSRQPREYFDRFFAEHRRGPASVGIWIGPEGDFAPAEYAAIKSSGTLPVTLGRLVLRVETAATYGLSIINYELQARVG
jgi:16S rRNA (uracil1498-N3)-methyltransferase